MDYSNRITSIDRDLNGQPVDGPQERLSFGQYKGVRVCDLLITDPGYLVWADANVGFFSLTMYDALTAGSNVKKLRDKYKRNAWKGRTHSGDQLFNSFQISDRDINYFDPTEH